jgi:superfamily II DNA or RNA helicase
MPIKLRDYQQEAVNKIYDSWNQGNRNVSLVMCTGLGKSVCMSSIALNFDNQHKPVAVVAHRNELVSQMSCHLARVGLYHRIIAPRAVVGQISRKHKIEFGKSFINPSALSAVVGVDTLMARADSLKNWAQQIALWEVDEQHHITRGNKWGKAVEMFVNARGLGVTATPNRADGQGLGRWVDGVMDDMVLGPSMRWAIENNFLADYEIVCPKSDLNVEDSPLSANGDWSSQTLRKAAKKSRIIGDVVTNYIKYAFGRKAIVFATDVETAEEISRDFNAHNIRAVSLNGKSLPAFREQSLDNFRDDKLQVLVNVDLFDEGFDVPSCDVCIMARPTASLGKFLQQVGRVLRPAPNKTALIIDHVSNVIRHGLPDMPREWSLERRQKKAKLTKDPDEIELTVCKKCLKPYEKFRTQCPYCGAELPVPESKSRTIEIVAGDLVLLDKATLQRLRQNAMLESPGNIAARVAKAAGPIAGKAAANRQMEKIEAQNELKDTIAQWAAIEREKGFNDREIYRRFYLSLGMDVLTALNGTRTRQDYLTTAERIKGWYE